MAKYMPFIIAAKYQRWILISFLFLTLSIWWIETPPGLLGKADAVGYAVCHRISERSFLFGERPFPLCARCSGMYLGAIAGIIWLLLREPGAGKLPSIREGIIFIIFAFAWGFDGLNSFLHLVPGAPTLYEPANWLRLLTGTGMGLSISAILVPAFNQTVWKTWSNTNPTDGIMRILLMIGFGILLDLFLLSGNPLLLYPLALISSAGVLIVLGSVYTLLLIMLFHKENSYTRWKELLVPMCAGFTIALLQIGIVDWARFALTSTWNGFSF
jgi:uncharacterized membrane protein